MMKPGVKPLGRIRRGHLMRKHVTKLIMKGIGIFRGLEIAEVLPPGSPTTGEPFKHLSGITLSPQLRLTVRSNDRIPLFISLQHSGFPKIFLGENINRELGPRLGNVDVFQLKHGRSVGIANFRRTFHERQTLIGTLPATCKSAFYSHDFPSSRLRPLCGIAYSPTWTETFRLLDQCPCALHPTFRVSTIDSSRGIYI